MLFKKKKKSAVKKSSSKPITKNKQVVSKSQVKSPKKVLKSKLKKTKDQTKTGKNNKIIQTKKSSKQAPVSHKKVSGPTAKRKAISSTSRLKGEKKASTNRYSIEDRKLLELKKELEFLNKKTVDKPLIKDAEGRLYCQHETCDQPAVTDSYCRYHYIALWRHLQTKKNLLENNYLLASIRELVKIFGEPCLHFILRDCKNEKIFESAIREMQLFSPRDEDVMELDKDAEY